MQDLIIPEPQFNSKVTQLIFDLEHLRDRDVKGTTPSWLFFDLKDIMHQLESLTSARIEGNRTTIMNVVESVIEGEGEPKDEQLLELKNINDALNFIENNVHGNPIDKQFITELHRLVVKGLTRDGSKYPGVYRPINVSIKESSLKVPHHARVPELMECLIEFINTPTTPQSDLLKTATAHHRFTAIHPFDNGNGRTVRLLTYAMLSQQNFIDDRGFRLLNPSAIFVMDRQKYYDKLAVADKGGEECLLEWCAYVLEGIKSEIEKIDKLLDSTFAKDNIIMPALKLSLEKKQLTPMEYDILKLSASKALIQVRDVQHELFGRSASDRVAASRAVSKLKDEGFLMEHPKLKQRYVLRFSNNYLLRGVMQQLDKLDLLPIKADG